MLLASKIGALFIIIATLEMLILMFAILSHYKISAVNIQLMGMSDE
jgi:hypothetical protein